MGSGRLSKAIRWAFVAIAGALLVWAVVSSWPEVSETLSAMSWGTVAGAFALCVIGLGLSLMSWRAVMRAIGLETGIVEAARVFGVSQIGKYIPGSVWPVLAQAEFARDHHVSRARAMTGSLVAMAVGAVTSGIVGAVGILIAVPDALTTYWWVLLAAVGLAAMLAPPVLSRLLRLAFRLTRRKEPPAHIGTRPLMVSAAWGVVQWTVIGLHAWLLMREIAPGTSAVLVVGAFALAWLAGFLVVIAPAGVGAREAALVLLLGSVATPAQALSLALVSRFLMTLADVVGFLVGLAAGGTKARVVANPEDFDTT